MKEGVGTALKNNGLLYEKNTEQNAIDLVKLIGAILVVLAHTSPIQHINEWSLVGNFEYGVKHIFLRGVVPFFFVSSGFLLYRGTGLAQPDNQRVKRHILKIIRLYLLWSIVYFPLSFLDILRNQKGLCYAVLVYIRNFMCYGTCVHLWYLHATAVATTLIAILLHKRVAPKQILKIACIFYVIGLLAQSWFGLIRPLKGTFVWGFLKAASKILAGTTRNGLFIGFAFTGIGMLFAFYGVPITKKQAGIGYLISMLFMLIEAFALRHLNFVRESDVYLFLLPAVFFAFAYILHIELPNGKIYRTMRLLSSIIYFVHIWIMRIVIKILRVIDEPLAETWMVFFLTLAISLICAWSILMLSNVKKFEWLKKFYS